MNGFDIVLLALACVLVLIGMLKGLVRLLIGVAALVAAFALAARYHSPLAARLDRLAIPPEVVSVASYVSIFFGVMVLGGLTAWLLRRLVRAAMLSWADRLGGAALGLVASGLIGGLLVLPAVAYLPGSQQMLEGSLLAPYVVAVADLANLLVPDELSERYRRGVEDLRRRWRGEGPPDTVEIMLRSPGTT